MMTAFYLHKNQQFEIYSKTLPSLFRIYTAEKKQNCDMLVQPLTCAEKFQVRLSTNDTATIVTLSRHLPGTKKTVSPSTLPDDAVSTTDSKLLQQKIIQQVAHMQEKVCNTSTKQQAKYKRYVNKKFHKIRAFTVVAQVYVDSQLLSLLTEDNKTSPRYNELLFRTTGYSTVMGLKSHISTINKKWYIQWHID